MYNVEVNIMCFHVMSHQQYFIQAFKNYDESGSVRLVFMLLMYCSPYHTGFVLFSTTQVFHDFTTLRTCQKIVSFLTSLVYSSNEIKFNIPISFMLHWCIAEGFYKDQFLLIMITRTFSAFNSKTVLPFSMTSWTKLKVTFKIYFQLLLLITTSLNSNFKWKIC